MAAENAEIIKELLPIFCNNHQQAEQFLAAIKDAEDTMITDTVKRLVGHPLIPLTNLRVISVSTPMPYPAETPLIELP
ncbi:MAG: hypothetical protein MJZ51_03745 [Bacteroidales bacterium]|nr:hypothetical protein [Bacteroidales bacterium]